jgi:hypothetical protein
MAARRMDECFTVQDSITDGKNGQGFHKLSRRVGAIEVIPKLYSRSVIPAGVGPIRIER